VSRKDEMLKVKYLMSVVHAWKRHNPKNAKSGKTSKRTVSLPIKEKSVRRNCYLEGIAATEAEEKAACVIYGVIP
jgi:hypothetical protein